MPEGNSPFFGIVGSCWIKLFEAEKLLKQIDGFGVKCFEFRGLNDYPPGNKYGNPQNRPMKTTGPLKGGHMSFHVSLGECRR